MSELTAARTLVKSAPELWAQCSDAESLGRHLQAFGEITITRLDPEQTVAWEGERARGTVQIEPSGWGTKVTLSAACHEAPPVPAASPPAAVAEPARAELAAAAPEAPPRRSFVAGLLGWLRPRRSSEAPEALDVLGPVVSEPREPEPEPAPGVDATAVFDGPAALDAALDSLGQAHRRPFSRS